MTITAISTKYEAGPGDGAEVHYTFPFQIYANTDIKVYKIVNSTGVATLQTLGADYTVALAATGPGGTVTYTTAPTALQNSFIILDLPATQATSLTTNGKFRDEDVEDMVDKLTLLVAQCEEILGRCLKVQADQADPAALPAFSTTAGYLYWNGTTFELKTP